MEATPFQLYEYAGSRLAVAELVGGVDFGEPQRVAALVEQHKGGSQFSAGIRYAYEHEHATPEPKGGREFYSRLCIAYDVR